MTLKIKSRSPRSNQLFTPSQNCICVSLVSICPLVHKITHGNEISYIKGRCDLENWVNPSIGSKDNAQKRSYADADGIRTKNNIFPSPFGWGDIKTQTNWPVCREMPPKRLTDWLKVQTPSRQLLSKLIMISAYTV